MQAIGDDILEIWIVALPRNPSIVDTLAESLSQDELARGQRFLRASDGAAFRAQRGALRHILGSYTGQAPAQLAFVADTSGKPSLLGPHSATLQFNISHSADRLMIGLARRAAIGVDIEAVRFDIDAITLSSRVLAPGERSHLNRATCPVVRTARFFEFWTQKEAVVKALGTGLAWPLDAFNVMAAIENDRGAWVAVPGASPERLFVRGIAVEDGFAAAVASSAPVPITVRRIESNFTGWTDPAALKALVRTHLAAPCLA